MPWAEPLPPLGAPCTTSGRSDGPYREGAVQSNVRPRPLPPCRPDVQAGRYSARRGPPPHTGAGRTCYPPNTVRAGPSNFNHPNPPPKAVDVMTSAEVSRRREQDLNRDRAPEGLTPAQEARRARARELYEGAGHSYGHYGEAAH